MSFRASRAAGRPRRRKSSSIKPFVFQCLERRLALSAVAWVNPSGGAWDVAANWSIGKVPGAGDDVTIDTASVATITLQSSENISLNSITTGANDTLSLNAGSLTVTANSTISGGLTMNGGSLAASGSGVSLTANGNTDADGSLLYAVAGGKLILPSLTSDSGNCALWANGNGSVLDLPSLTTVAFGGAGGSGIAAEKGGKVEVPDLTTVTSDRSYDRSYFSDTGGGSLVDGSLTTLSGVSVSLDGTDPNVASSWTNLTDGMLTITTGSVTLPALTDFDGSQLYASAGGTVGLPALTSYVAPDSTDATAFKADGSGSTIDLTALTRVTQGQGGAFNVAATNGGDIEIPDLTTVSNSGSQTLPVSFIGGGTISDGKLTSP